MLYYGACYYPEHWTPEQAKEHIPLMKKAGINVVRMGEFAWCKFEPEQGRFKFDWMDAAVAELAKAGIATVMCTPTCIPPQWVFTKHPNILQRDVQGHVRHPGARCHVCKNAPEFQILAEQITQAMAKHYAGVEGVIGWQTDNEFGCHGTTRCYCDHCQKAFQDWLLEKYKDTDEVNKAWGTSFWGFDFRQWNEIPLPRKMPTGPNPGHWLDFCRFSSDSQIKFHKMQYDWIKSLAPKHFVTHNLMGTFPEINYYALAEYLDFPVWDNYPDAYGDPHHTAYAHAITRSLKGRFWVMEQKSGPTGDADTGLMGEQPEQGELRRWAWQAVANGADGVSYFRWRPCLTGAEQYWHGILDHDGGARRRYAEVRLTGDEFAKVGAELKGTLVTAPVALVRSFDCLWSLERQPGAPQFSYDGHCFACFRAVKAHGQACDIVNEQADLARYKVVIAPALTICSLEFAKKLDAFVRGGGTLVLTPQSGARTPANAMLDIARPGYLAEMCGLQIAEVRPYHHGQTETVTFKQGALAGQDAAADRWVEVLRLATADVVAEYAGGPLDGKPAAACNAHGEGRVYYLGALLPQEALTGFLGGVLPEFPVKDIPDGVEITRRRDKDKRVVFVLNHGRERREVTLPGEFPALLPGASVGPTVALGPNGVLVLKA